MYIPIQESMFQAYLICMYFFLKSLFENMKLGNWKFKKKNLIYECIIIQESMFKSLLNLHFFLKSFLESRKFDTSKFKKKDELK